MANPADKYAQKTFSQLESQMSKQYREAYKDISKKLQDFTRRHKAKDKQMQRDLKNGKITQEQYASWLRGQVFIGQQWQDAKASLDLAIKNVMTEAAHLTHQKSVDVFVDNANYTAYQIEKDTNGGINFQIYDRKTVSRLMLEDPELLPRGRDINGNKLSAWNTKVIANCVTQSILQGESIDELSKRIARDTCISAGRSSLLYARTAMTGAQNAGRVERMKEAEEMGIKVQKQWMATLDSRTRDTHRSMDGEIVDTDEEFSNGLEYPGDPAGDPREVYNCRCTIIYHYPEYSDYSKMERTAYYEEGDPEYDPDHRNYETVKGMNYEQWVNYKQDQIRARYSEEPEIVQGTGIEELRSIAERSVDKYDFWTNLDENQQAIFRASSMSLDDAYNTLHGNAVTKEWKDPSPGGAQSFAIKHDFSSANVDFVKVKARSEGWMADANVAGVINVRENGLGEGWEFIIGHEAGHQLADFSDEIQQMIIMNPGDVFGRYNLRLMAFDGVYGEYNPEEAFATCVSNFIRHPDAMKDKYPKAYEAIDTLFKTSPSALDFVHRIMDKYRKEFL